MKLNLKFALYISAAAIISCCLLSALSYQGTKRRVESRQYEAIAALVSNISQVVVSAAELQNINMAREIVYGLKRHPAVACAELSTPSLVKGTTATCRGDLFYQQKLYSNHRDDLGTIKIYIDMSYLAEQAKAHIWAEVGTIFKVIFVTSTIILVATYWLFTKPIEVIVDKLKTIDFDSGDFSLGEESERADEIGYINRSIHRMLRDAYAYIQRERRLAKQTALLTNNFKMIFTLSGNALAVTDEHLRLRSFNPCFEELIAKKSNVYRVMNSDRWLDFVCEDAMQIKKIILASDVQDKPVSVDMEWQDPERRDAKYFTLNFVKTEDATQGKSILIFINDMTEHRQQLMLSQYNASYDNLTRLLNRRAATEKAQQLLANTHIELALLVVDLDGFKRVNDEYGHDAGDKLLQIIAQRLGQNSRRADIVSRWGGDEFVVVLADVDSGRASEVASKILTSILQPVHIASLGVTESIGASIGIASSMHVGRDFATLFYHADRAMYAVKGEGKGAVGVHSGDAYTAVDATSDIHRLCDSDSQRA